MYINEMLTGLLWLGWLAGHLAIWSAAFNQMHATDWPRWLRKIFEKVIYVLVIALFASVVWHAWSRGDWRFPFPGTQWQQGYFWLGLLAMLFVTARHIYRRCQPPESPVLQHSNHRLRIDRMVDRPLLAGWQAHLLKLIPGNQVLYLAVETKQISVPQLPPTLEGLRLTHLSDFHFTGKIDREYFHRVVDESNRWQPDFVCLTGDIVDKSQCLPWVGEILQRVEAKRAKLFILGNHDRRIQDEPGLRQAMRDAGWIDAASGWHPFPIGEETIVFAGNELPWFTGANELEPRDIRPGELRVLLAHSPDQFAWAQERQFHLVLAGHMHGGQVRFPWIGPVIAPSRHGVKYACGAFFENGVALHVSRGISSDDPIRWNCPPELALLELTSPHNKRTI